MGHSNYTYLKLNKKSALQNKQYRRSSVNGFFKKVNKYTPEKGREGRRSYGGEEGAWEKPGTGEG